VRRKWRVISAAYMTLGSFIAFAGAPSVDSQLWSELDATHAVSADLSATAIVTTRLGSNLPNPMLTAGGLQIDYRFKSSWILSGTGYYVLIRESVTGSRTTIWFRLHP
jgi:hypothetical protein